MEDEVPPTLASGYNQKIPYHAGVRLSGTARTFQGFVERFVERFVRGFVGRLSLPDRVLLLAEFVITHHEGRESSTILNDLPIVNVASLDHSTVTSDDSFFHPYHQPISSKITGIKDQTRTRASIAHITHRPLRSLTIASNKPVSL